VSLGRLAAAHLVGRFPFERVVDRIRVVAGLALIAAELAEAFPRIASALAVLEFTFIDALGERPAGGFFALPLLLVILRPGPETEVLGATEVRLAPIIALV